MCTAGLQVSAVMISATLVINTQAPVTSSNLDQFSKFFQLEKSVKFLINPREYFLARLKHDYALVVI